MNRVAQRQFLELTNKFIKSQEAMDPKLKKKKENTYTAKIIIPLVENALKLDYVFDETDEDGKRPDIQAFLKPRSDLEGPVVLIESKWPTEFENLNNNEIIEKFLADKFQPYILTHKLSCRFFIIHNFKRYLVTRVDDNLIHLLEKYKAKKLTKAAIITEINARTSDFNFTSNPKKFKTAVQNFLGFLDTELTHDVLTASANSASINSVAISNDIDLKKVASRIAKLVEASDETDGLLNYINTTVHKELNKPVSSLKMVYRLFLSTRRPDLSKGQDIEAKADNEKQRKIFVLSSMYSLIGKVFLVKFMQDMLSDESRKLLNTDYCFLHQSIPDNNDTNLGSWFKSEVAKMKVALPEGAQKLLSRNSFFDWILDTDCLDNRFFREILLEFQRVDFRRSFEESNYDGDLLGAFFETFTERFDKSTRQALGQYYTPKPIVKYMWTQVKEVIKAEGLEKTDIRILDPACGSGTFLVQAVKELWKDYEEDMLDRLVAFDISPFVVGLAEINIFTEIMKHANKKQMSRLKAIEIFNSDSLDIRKSDYWQKREAEETDESNLKFLRDQSYVATKLKKKKEYTVIVTNPPYNGSSSRNLKSLKGRFDLTDTLLEKSTKDDRIRDDYVWFMAAIDRYINQNGIICLITNDSYVTKRSYRELRGYLSKNYRIHKIVRCGKALFDDVKIGTAIIVMSKFKDIEVISKNQRNNNIEVVDLRQLKINIKDRSKDERYQYLEGVLKVSSTTVVPNEKNCYSFADNLVIHDSISILPSSGSNAAINDKESGVVTGLKEFFYDTSQQKLLTRIQDFFEIAARVTLIKKSIKNKKEANGHNASNDEIKALGIDILERKHFSDVQDELFKFAKAHEIPMQKTSEDGKQKGPLYLAFLAASITLKEMSFTAENIQHCKTLGPDDRWAFSQISSGYIYFDNRFSIPRINMKSNSDISGGPTTAWRNDNLLAPKICLTTPSGDKGISRLTIAENDYNPVILKAVDSGDTEAHFVPLSRISVPTAFASIFPKKIDYVHYLQGVANSDWVDKNKDFIVTNKLQIPLPRNDNKTLIVNTSNYAKQLHELHKANRKIARLRGKSKVNLKSILDHEILHELKLPSEHSYETAQRALEKAITGAEHSLNSTVNTLLALHKLPSKKRKAS